MNKYKHLLSFDLTSYGAAMSIVNQFADGEQIRDFEISPCGSGAQLILLSQDLLSLKFVRTQVESLFKSQTADVSLVEDFHQDLLETYLAQNKVSLNKHMMILEGSSLSEGFELADKLLKSSVNVVEFRMIRGASKNVMITSSDDSVEKLDGFNSRSFKKTLIQGVQPSLRSYWQF